QGKSSGGKGQGGRDTHLAYDAWRIMKARWRLVGLAIVVVAWAAIVCAESVSQLQPTGYVNDFAQVLDPNTKAQIEDIARQIDEKAHRLGFDASQSFFSLPIQSVATFGHAHALSLRFSGHMSRRVYRRRGNRSG